MCIQWKTIVSERSYYKQEIRTKIHWNISYAKFSVILDDVWNTGLQCMHALCKNLGIVKRYINIIEPTRWQILVEFRNYLYRGKDQIGFVVVSFVVID